MNRRVGERPPNFGLCRLFQPFPVTKHHLAILFVIGIIGVAINRIYFTALIHPGQDSSRSLAMNAQLIVVAPTYYASIKEPRFSLALESCRQAAKYGIRLFIVDGSSSEDVKEGMERAGKNGNSSFVRVIPQKAKGKKGVALREAIGAARDQFVRDNVEIHKAVIAFQELEKYDMFRHWHSLVDYLIDTKADVVLPRRANPSFQKTYPIEQYHSESFANLYLDSLGQQIGLPSIDYTIGPMAFRATSASYWLSFDGQIWDAQLVPMIHAHVDGKDVVSLDIDYHHPPLQKEEEEHKPEWCEKRLLQLNHLEQMLGTVIKQHIKKS